MCDRTIATASARDGIEPGSFLRASLSAATSFLVLAIAVSRGKTVRVNRRVRKVVRPRSNKRFTRAAELASKFAAPDVHPLAAVALALAVRPRVGRAAMAIPLASVAATAVDKGMRLVIHQERPPHAGPHKGLDRYAFPSGHTCAATAVAFASVAELWPGTGRKARTAAVILAAITAGGVAWTRLYLDEHWIDDIVGGLLAGVAIGSASVAVTQYASSPERLDLVMSPAWRSTLK